MSEGLRGESGQPDFEARKKLIAGLKPEDGFTVNGEDFTFSNVDNPHFPHFIYGRNIDGKTTAFDIRKIESGELETSIASQNIEQEASKSELSTEVLKIIDSSLETSDDMAAAFSIFKEFGQGLPSNPQLRRLSKILAANRDNEAAKNAIGDKINHSAWLATEAIIQAEERERV